MRDDDDDAASLALARALNAELNAGSLRQRRPAPVKISTHPDADVSKKNQQQQRPVTPTTTTTPGTKRRSGTRKRKETVKVSRRRSSGSSNKGRNKRARERCDDDSDDDYVVGKEDESASGAPNVERTEETTTTEAPKTPSTHSGAMEQSSDSPRVVTPKNTDLKPTNERVASPDERRREEARLLKSKDLELKEFPPGVMVWVRLSTSNRGQWWPGRTWKLRQCTKIMELLEIKPKGPCALVRLFGSNCFEWAVAEDLAAYDALRQSEYRHQMLEWYKSCKRKSGGRPEALRACRAADAAEMAEWSDPWSTSEDESSESEEETEEAEKIKANVAALESMKVGLTPDWIIHGACKVFQLELPTIEAPLIKGLLDPCTNSHLKPNIPAEKCYDKKDDGLKMSNKWAGYHVLVNPPYEAQVQWRFINRAINEVEWEHCPGVILVCRNSTDTSYFQRLLPFPRIHLKRSAVQFKDYERCPIGFGICVFCIVSPTHPQQAEIYSRFYDEFHKSGEFNIPVDEKFVKSAPFIELTTRLHRVACESYRDSWIACDVCDRWREIPFAEMLKARKAKVWQCRDSFPMGCRTPLTKNEIRAFSVAKAEKNTVLVASKREGVNGPVGIYAAETLNGEIDADAAEDADAAKDVERAEDAEEDEDEDHALFADDERDEANEEERTKEFVQSGGTLHGLGCPCNWAPCRERRLKERRILSKTFPGLRVEWEKMRDELTNTLTPYEKERLQNIEKNKSMMQKLMCVKEKEVKTATQKVFHTSAAESAALRMWEIAKRRHRMKSRNAERREQKVAALRKLLTEAETRLSDMMKEVVESSKGLDEAVQVLEAIRARSKRFDFELAQNTEELREVKQRVARRNRDSNKQFDKIWDRAHDRVEASTAPDKDTDAGEREE
jgi:hypothetical protein